jgi:hypothetical protein
MFLGPLRYCLEIGLYHPLHTKLLGDPIQFIKLQPFATPCVRQRLQGHVKADLVSKSKTVSHRPGEAVDANNLSFDTVLLDPNVEDSQARASLAALRARPQPEVGFRCRGSGAPR